MSDSLTTGRHFRTFKVIDDFNRAGLGIEIDVSLSAKPIARVLNRIADRRGYPRYIRCDNGPELRSAVLQRWAKEHDITFCYIEPGKPTQNVLVERFNSSHRREVLNAYLFDQLTDVRVLTENWLYEYNLIRPHAGIGNVPPAFFKRENSIG